MGHKGYLTNLASEFHVLSILSRLGCNANLTLGNRKAIDIVVVSEDGGVATIDVKAVAGKFDWILGNSPIHVAPNHYYALLSYEGRFADVSAVPRVWIFPSAHLSDYIKLAGNNKTRYISRKSIIAGAAENENAWHFITDAK